MFFIDIVKKYGIIKLNGGFIMVQNFVNSKKLMFIFALLGSIFLAGYLPLVLQPQLNQHCLIFKKAQEECLTAHDKAIAQIVQEFKVPQKTWQRYDQAIQDAIAHDDLLGIAEPCNDIDEPAIIQSIRKILIEYGINPARVNIVKTDKNDEYAQAIQDIDAHGKIIHTIEINIEWFGQFTFAMQEAFIRHEIMHLLNYDCIEKGYIVFMLDSLGYSPQEAAQYQSFIAYNHQQELRADKLASCAHFDVANALHEHYALQAQEFDNDDQALWFSHPCPQARADQLALVIQGIKPSPSTLS